MPRAYCSECKKHVNAMPKDSGIMGAVKIDREEGADVYLPIRNPWQNHYCPVCGSVVVPKGQTYSKDEYQTASNVADVLFPICILAAIIMCAPSLDRPAGDGIAFLLVFIIGFNLFLWWVFHVK